MNQSEFWEIIGNLLKAQEKSRVQGAIGLAYHQLKNWRQIFKSITKLSNPNRVITTDNHLKTALSTSNLSSRA